MAYVDVFDGTSFGESFLHTMSTKFKKQPWRLNEAIVIPVIQVEETVYIYTFEIPSTVVVFSYFNEK